MFFLQNGIETIKRNETTTPVSKPIVFLLTLKAG